jgi:hypothetical protein
MPRRQEQPLSLTGEWFDERLIQTECRLDVQVGDNAVHDSRLGAIFAMATCEVYILHAKSSVDRHRAGQVDNPMVHDARDF